MKLITGLSALFFLFTEATFGQENFHTSYNWEVAPVLGELSENEANEHALYLKDLRTIEYVEDAYDRSIFQYYTIHNRIRVNTHDAIEMYNKKFIPMGRVLDIESVRVRVITAEGVREIENVEILDYQGEDDYSSLKYFAIEGVEIGSEIEYIYTLKMIAKLDGSREFFQGQELRKNVEFNIICPEDMIFSMKSYNGFADIVNDTLSDVNHYHASMETIQPLLPELYAPYTNSLMRVEYKLDYLKPAVGFKLFTYDQLSGQLFKYLKQELSKKEKKKLKKLLNTLKIESYSEKEKIRIIEDYVKGNIALQDQSEDEYENLELVLENMYANKRGIVRLFVALFDLLDINYQCGFTSDRTITSLDPEFETYSSLENYLFYFPNIKEYMAPTEVLFRLGYIPYNWSNNYGLFIKNVVIGGRQEGIGELRFIEPLSYDKNLDKLVVDVAFSSDFEYLDLNIRRELTGYNTSFIQPVFEYIPKDETKKVVNELLNLSGQDIDLLNSGISNTSFDSMYLQPFVIKGNVKTGSSFFDVAGNRFLFKIGEVIGEQVEMYQEKERKLPVQNDYNRNYVREINFEIPEGYTVDNLEDLKICISFTDEEGETPMAFISEYTKTGNRVSVIINEFYKRLDFPVENFEDFRSVINAAADFNKKILVFRKN